MKTDMLRPANLPVELMIMIARYTAVEYRADTANAMGLKMPNTAADKFTFTREMLAFNFAADFFDTITDEATKWPASGSWDFIASNGRMRKSPLMYQRGRSYEPYNRTIRRQWMRQAFGEADNRRQYRSRAMENNRIHGNIDRCENLYRMPKFKVARLI